MLHSYVIVLESKMELECTEVDMPKAFSLIILFLQIIIILMGFLWPGRLFWSNRYL